MHFVSVCFVCQCVSDVAMTGFVPFDHFQAAHPRMKFDFEAVPLKGKELHALILQEVLCYHPKQRSKFEEAGFPMPRRRKIKK